MNDRNSTLYTLLSIASGAAVTTCAFLAIQAAADQNAATDQVSRLIPYNGTLELNGQRVTATGAEGLWFRFDIHDASAAGSPVVYSQRQQLSVVNGRFQTVLGPSDANNVQLNDVIAGADDLWVEVIVLNDPADDADDIALSHPQRLLVAPFALWANRATDFSVGNDMTILGNLDLSSDLTNRLFAGTIETGNINAGGRPFAIHSDVMVLGDHTSGTTSGSTSIGGDLNVTGQTSVANDTQAGGALSVGGDVRATTQTTVSNGVIEGLTQINPGGPDTTFASRLTARGALVVRTTTANANSGIDFPTPTGSDDAWLRYYVDGTATDTALQLGVTADPIDRISILHGASEVMHVRGDEVNFSGRLEIGGQLTGTTLGTNVSSTNYDVPGEARQNNSTPGSWRTTDICGAGKYVCGMRILASTGGDAQGATDAELRCCNF